MFQETMTEDELQNQETAMTEMASKGLHLGRQKSKGHPKMKPYVYAVQNGFQIIDLSKTVEYLEAALNFLADIVKKGGVILFVGTAPSARNIIEEAAKSVGMPYVNRRWIGGTLTNFKVVSGRLNHYKDLLKKREAGELQKYTKKERLEFDKEIAKLGEKFGGIVNLEKAPSAVFIVNTKTDEIAVREARRTEVPVVALVNTDTDPTLIDWLIPANNSAVSAVKYVVDKVAETINKNKGEIPKINNE